MKGTPAGQKNWSEETRGQWGWEGGGGRVSGQGEDAASPRVGGPELTSGAERARLGVVGRINPPHGREFYGVQEGQRGQ